MINQRNHIKLLIVLFMLVVSVDAHAQRRQRWRNITWGNGFTWEQVHPLMLPFKTPKMVFFSDHTNQNIPHAVQETQKTLTYTIEVADEDLIIGDVQVCASQGAARCISVDYVVSKTCNENQCGAKVSITMQNEDLISAGEELESASGYNIVLHKC
ncbi:MAG: hypothetical protein KDK51_06375 [Deltaproteobacteria bacterium]|nr:hypothetical protein [Deltaproteobacteria bacterium]